MKFAQWASCRFGVMLLLLSGCAGVSPLEGIRSVQAQVMRSDANASPIARTLGRDAADARVVELLRSPLALSASLEIALLRNPQVIESYARVGVSQADVVAASRIANPTFSGSLITGAGERQAVGQIDQSITDLLLLASRRRLADADYQRNQAVVAQALTDLLREVEAACYRCVAAAQVARLRAAKRSVIDHIEGRRSGLASSCAENFSHSSANVAVGHSQYLPDFTCGAFSAAYAWAAVFAFAPGPNVLIVRWR